MTKPPSPPGKMPTPVWPSVDEQLAAAKVTHGSALEKLVRENQEFDMLRQEEAHDQLGIPHWLRVYWRKHHPEATYSASDPTGGYPRTIKNVYVWMQHNQDLPGGGWGPPKGGETQDKGGRHVR